MYKVDTENKKLIPLESKTFKELGLQERYDIEEWLESNPGILGEDLLIITKEYILPSQIRLDLMAIDKKGNLVVIELKRDDSGKGVEWQAIKYASYCSNLSSDEILQLYAEKHNLSPQEAQDNVLKFLEPGEEIESLNQEQRIILVARDFHSDVASAVLWLRDYDLDIKCVRLEPYVGSTGDLFIVPIVIIPLPEAADYIEKKISRQKEIKENSMRSPNITLKIKTAVEKGLLRQGDKLFVADEYLTTDEVQKEKADHPEFFMAEISGKASLEQIAIWLGDSNRECCYLSGVTKKLQSYLREKYGYEFKRISLGEFWLTEDRKPVSSI